MHHSHVTRFHLQHFYPSMDHLFTMRVNLLRKKLHRLCIKHPDAKVSISIEMHGQKFVFKSSRGLPGQHNPVKNDATQQQSRAGVDAPSDITSSHVGCHEGRRVPTSTEELPPYTLRAVSHKIILKCAFSILLVVNNVFIYRQTQLKFQFGLQWWDYLLGRRLRETSLVQLNRDHYKQNQVIYLSNYVWRLSQDFEQQEEWWTRRFISVEWRKAALGKMGKWSGKRALIT